MFSVNTKMLSVKTKDGRIFTLPKDHEIMEKGFLKLIDYKCCSEFEIENTLEVIPINSEDFCLLLFSNFKGKNFDQMLLHMEVVMPLSITSHIKKCVSRILETIEKDNFEKFINFIIEHNLWEDVDEEDLFWKFYVFKPQLKLLNLIMLNIMKFKDKRIRKETKKFKEIISILKFYPLDEIDFELVYELSKLYGVRLPDIMLKNSELVIKLIEIKHSRISLLSNEEKQLIMRDIISMIDDYNEDGGLWGHHNFIEIMDHIIDTNVIAVIASDSVDVTFILKFIENLLEIMKEDLLFSKIQRVKIAYFKSYYKQFVKC